VFAHGVHVSGVRHDVDLFSVDGQAATAMTAVMEMRYRQLLSEVVP